MNPSSATPRSGPWRIGFCQPEFKPLHRVTTGEMNQQAYIQQGYIAAGLQSRGHELIFVAPQGWQEILCMTDTREPAPAPRTWSSRPWFDLAGKGLWRIQQWLGLPYMNLFANCRLFDACLQCLAGCDVVHMRHGLYREGLAMACKRLRLPFVLFLDADELFERDFLGIPITGVLRWRAQMGMRYSLGVADCIVCVSEPAKTHLVTTWNISPEKIVVLPNGVDVERHRPHPELRERVRIQWGIGDVPLVVFVGRFYRWHDVESLLQAFAQALRAFPDASLLLVGDGDRRKEMEQQSLAMGLGPHVVFTGLLPHDQISALVGVADVAVAPYPPMDHEFWGSPMKLFEYMASGAAIVASSVGQVAEVIQDGSNGLLVPPGDAAALAQAMVRLMADESLRAQLGHQARRDAVARHSWDGYVARLERVYAAVIAREPLELL